MVDRDIENTDHPVDRNRMSNISGKLVENDQKVNKSRFEIGSRLNENKKNDRNASQKNRGKEDTGTKK